MSSPNNSTNPSGTDRGKPDGFASPPKGEAKSIDHTSLKSSDNTAGVSKSIEQQGTKKNSPNNKTSRVIVVDPTIKKINPSFDTTLTTFVQCPKFHPRITSPQTSGTQVKERKLTRLTEIITRRITASLVIKNEN